MQVHFQKIAQELGVSEKQVSATVKLLDEGATIPFIARYRKELTGSLDEVYIGSIRDRVHQLRELDKRRESIIASLKELEKWTVELDKKLQAAETMAVLEDIYLPYKPKRKTKASIAKEKGLEPFALRIWEQAKFDLETLAEAMLDPEKGLNTTEEVLSGASDILAEMVAENAEVRKAMRQLFEEKAIVKTSVISGKEAEGVKYKDYFDWKEPLKAVPSHRLLAMRRGEKELVLRMDIAPDEEDAHRILQKHCVKGNTAASLFIQNKVLPDSYKRLLKPSMETEVRVMSKQKADEEAIKVFAENVRQLLLAAPLGQKRILAIDPGFRTGCKVVCLNEQGDLLENQTINPHASANEKQIAEKTLLHFIEKHRIEAIAIGNGTAGRETEAFVKSLSIGNTSVIMVNESGASVYSASEVARNEFPDKDITVRGAVSIGRRLMDPLAELVKIDPKSVGVGQYQHDVDQNKLQKSLDDTVESCVNTVGVELNTASEQLLSYVSGLGPQLAKNIVEYRTQKGKFSTREDLKKVPRMGDKAYEQAAGFLRIQNANNPLDASAVHPERYALVESMAKNLDCAIRDLILDENLRKKIALKDYVSDEVGLPTLQDIMAELAKPGRDPREQFEVFSFAEGVNDILDLRIGMSLPGIVTNITKFGVFVDIGVHQDGLVHLSELANKFVKDANEVVKMAQKVQVTVKDVDIDRKRITLSMKESQTEKVEKRPNPTAQSIKKPTPAQKKPQGDLADQLEALKNKFQNR